MLIINKNNSFFESLKPLISLMEEEVNTPSISFSTDISKFVQYSVLPNSSDLGKRLKNKFNKKFIDSVKNMTEKQIAEYKETGKITVDGVELKAETNDLIIKEKYVAENIENYFALGGEDEICILLDTRQNEKLKNIGIIREVVNKVQKMRKKAGLNVDDNILVFYKAKENSESLKIAIEKERVLAETTIKKPFIDCDLVKIPKHAIIIKREAFELDEMKFEIIICNETFFINQDSLKV